MTTYALIVAAAAVALGIGTRTRLPASVLAIVAGVALRAVGAPIERGITRDGLLMAATFLVFTVAAEVDRRPLRPYRSAALGLMARSLLVTAAAGGLLFVLLDLDPWAVGYLVVALGTGSSLFVFEVLRRRERFFEPVGRLVTATSLAQDVLVVVVLSVFVAVAALSRGAPLAALGALGELVGLAAAAAITSHWIAPRVMVRGGLDEEERLLFVLLILFAFTAVARWVGSPLVVGAYFAGLAVSRFPTGGVVRGYLKSFADFFTMVFYVSLGLLVAAPSLTQLVADAVLVSALLLARPFVLLPLVRKRGFTVRSSLEAIALLAPAGELAVIVALVGVELGHVGEHTLGVVVAVVVLTSALAPWLSSDRVTRRLTHAYPFGPRPAPEPHREGHVLLLGCGQTGAVVLEGLRAASAEVVVVDDDPAVVQALEAQGVPVLRGDGADAKVLEAAGAARARAVVSTMRRWEDNTRLLSTLHGPRVFVRVFSEAQAERVRALGGHPVAEAETAAEALLRWQAAQA